MQIQNIEYLLQQMYIGKKVTVYVPKDGSEGLLQYLKTAEQNRKYKKVSMICTTVLADGDDYCGWSYYMSLTDATGGTYTTQFEI